MRSECGQTKTSYTARGLPRYETEVRHEGLGKYQLIRGDDSYVVEQKAQAKMDQWDSMWEQNQEAEKRRLERQQRAEAIQDKKDLAAERTQEANAAIDAWRRNTDAHWRKRSVAPALDVTFTDMGW